MEGKSLEVSKFGLKKLLGLTENIIEKNFSAYLVRILILSTITYMLLTVNESNQTAYIGMVIIHFVTTFLAEVTFLQKVKSDIEQIDNQKVSGNLAMQTIFMLCVYTSLIMILSIILTAGLIVLDNFYTEITVDEIVRIINIVSIPLIIGYVCASLWFSGIAYEVFIKNNIKFTALKNASKNIFKSKNSTFAKMFFGVSFGGIGYTIMASVAYMYDVKVLLVLAMAIYFFFKVYLYVVYMSSKTEF